MKNLTSNTENDSSGQHDCKGVLKPSKSKDEMADYTKGGSYDENPSCSYFIDEHASQKRDDDVGESIEGVKQVEL